MLIMLSLGKYSVSFTLTSAFKFQEKPSEAYFANNAWYKNVRKETLRMFFAVCLAQDWTNQSARGFRITNMVHTKPTVFNNLYYNCSAAILTTITHPWTIKTVSLINECRYKCQKQCGTCRVLFISSNCTTNDNTNKANKAKITTESYHNAEASQCQTIAYYTSLSVTSSFAHTALLTIRILLCFLLLNSYIDLQAFVV